MLANSESLYWKHKRESVILHGGSGYRDTPRSAQKCIDIRRIWEQSGSRMNTQVGNLFAGCKISLKWISNVSFYFLYNFQAGYSFVSLWVLIWDLAQNGGFPVFSDSAEVLCWVTAMDWWPGVGHNNRVGSCGLPQLSLGYLHFSWRSLD